MTHLHGEKTRSSVALNPWKSIWLGTSCKKPDCPSTQG